MNIADRIFPVLPLLVSELSTFNVNYLLNDDSYRAGEILGVLLERNLYLKFKLMMKPYFHLYLMFSYRQLDNDDANYDENDIDIFSRTDKHKTYEIPQENNLYTMSRSALQVTISHQLSAAILLLFISAAVVYFAQGSHLER